MGGNPDPHLFGVGMKLHQQNTRRGKGQVQRRTSYQGQGPEPVVEENLATETVIETHNSQFEKSEQEPESFK